MVQLQENRARMWAFIFLCIVGLSIHQSAGEDNSTQMYYAKLIIEKEAIGNITQSLTSIVNNVTLQVHEAQMTTRCQNVSSNTECSCESGYRWSDKVCQSKKCCGNSTCIFPQNSSHMCVSDTTVNITGSVTITGTSHQGCLAEKDSEPFQTCNNNLLQKMKKVYSTLTGFDVLKITKYSVGSIIVDFEMIIVSNLKPEALINKSNALTETLSGLLKLETTGVVSLSMPENPVRYSSQHNLMCTSKTDLDTLPVWQLKKDDKFHDITNGTESVVVSNTRQSTLTIKNVSEIWEGEYKCTFLQKSESYTIAHTASAVMDVALLPIISNTTDPGFPSCQERDLQTVTGKCAIKKSYENYTVTWTKHDIEASVTPKPYESIDGKLVYMAETVVSCSPSSKKPQLTCTFTNRRNQNRSASVCINIIYAGEKYCEPEGDWEVTKAGFTAVLHCENEDGQRRRKCNNSTTLAKWEEEESDCVNRNVSRVLQNAKMVDIGLGSLDENAARVFSRLEIVTNKTDSIKGFANMEASVSVLSTLSQKLTRINNDSTVNNLLDSSSNLLEESLENSWTGKTNKENLSLAETYLSSFEQLIEVTNVTNNKTKTNIEVSVCRSEQGSECNNKVFNVTVKLAGSGNNSVKTAGFKQLDKYLPNRDEEFKPNSIVVSTTTEKKLDSVKVEIKFELLSPRPRNVKMQCVSWDNVSGQWSSYGCQWKGASEEGGCVCTHLSSFAILMSKYPVEIPGMDVITKVGLSVSVVSLVISLVIEMIVWSAVVKTNTLYLRHIAHINISLCLLVGNCCFLASSKPNLSDIWCKTTVVLKHFCYLSMFFWMLCLSATLLHQAIFMFHNVSKKNYLRFSLILGYACPLLIVTITFLTNSAGAEGSYYSIDTCWLIYTQPLQGSIHTFLIPVGIIVFVNVFSMLVVIMKLLDHPKNAGTSHEKEKAAAKTVIRTVILLTPIFGVTWIVGFGVMLIDLTSGVMALVINYAFTLLNAFQGLFILLTTCLGDKQTREALLSHLKKNRASASISDSTTKLDSTMKK